MAVRADLLDGVTGQLRLQAGIGLALHQAVAERFGLNPSDLKCLDIAARGADVTAGRIAQLTAMSTSAVTALLDRLEKRGFIERRRDAADRRRVFVTSTGRHERELSELYAPLAAATGAILDAYSDEELRLITGFLTRMTAAGQAFIGTAAPRAAHAAGRAAPGPEQAAHRPAE